MLALSGVGVYMLRRVGIVNSRQLLVSLQQGHDLSLARMNTALKLFSALMFMFPGFLTSALGLIWSIPLVRSQSIKHLVKHGMRFTRIGHVAIKPNEMVAANDD